MSDSQPFENRLIGVESLLMLLQHDLEQMNQAVLAQQQELEELRRQIGRIGSVLDDYSAEPRQPADERPPHY